MTLTPLDWRRLRMPLLGLGGALVAVGLLVSLADQYHNKNEAALQNQQNLLNQARAKFQSSGQEKETIIEYLPVYNELLAKGFVGEERRIEWIETLRQIHARYKLFSIDYSIGLQEDYKPSFISNMGSFTLHRSTMKLDMDMLHEGDILSLLEGLHEQTTPLIVRECELQRPMGVPINSKNLVANLKATCQIDWLTLRDPQLGGNL